MPQINVAKQFVAESYYHIYNHFVGDLELFKEIDYCAKYLDLLDRYLGKRVHKSENGLSYPKLNKKIEILGFCLMPNHLHLLVYQKDKDAITELMRRIETSFSKYVNMKRKRRGALFETVYKASFVDKDDYLIQVSRYIHLNPWDMGRNHTTYTWSSYQDYIENNRFTWLKPEKVLSVFNFNPVDYARFVNSGLEERRIHKST